jgi:hypothetical protein
MEISRFSHLFARLTMLLLLGGCLAFWPLAGYAATAWMMSADSGVDEAAQASLVATKSANVSEAAAGTTIIYTYRITNEGPGPLFGVTAVDDRLGAVEALETNIFTAGLSLSAMMSYVVQASDPAGPLVNTLTVTSTNSLEQFVIVTATAEVLITDPTALPETEQPNQPQVAIFLPLIEP